MIEEFRNYLTAIKGYSEKTGEAYAKDVRQVGTWMLQHRNGVRWSTMTREDIDAYIMSEAERGMKPATTNRRLASVSALYKWLKRNGHDIADPTRFESRRKIAKHVPNTIPVEQLREAYNHSAGVARVMLGLLCSTGIRIQELLDLQWDDINFETHEIRIEGKGGKGRVVTTTWDALEVLHGVTLIRDTRGAIFTLKQREARVLVWQALRPYCKARQLSPHAIRHTVATQLAKNGENVATIANILGHEHIETTQKYLDMAQIDAKKAMTKLNIL